MNKNCVTLEIHEQMIIPCLSYTAWSDVSQKANFEPKESIRFSVNDSHQGQWARKEL